jgi:hypothetical protein
MKICKKRDLKREAELKAALKCTPLARRIKGKHAGGGKGRIWKHRGIALRSPTPCNVDVIRTFPPER